MEEYFDTETILSVVTKINYAKNLNKIYHLYWFLFDNDFINMDGIVLLDMQVSNHLLNIYPELLNIDISNINNLDKCIETYKNIFGDKLLISKIGVPLKKTHNKKLSKI